LQYGEIGTDFQKRGGTIFFRHSRPARGVARSTLPKRGFYRVDELLVLNSGQEPIQGPRVEWCLCGGFKPGGWTTVLFFAPTHSRTPPPGTKTGEGRGGDCFQKIGARAIYAPMDHLEGTGGYR